MDEVKEAFKNLRYLFCCLDCLKFLKHWRKHEKESIRPPVVDVLPCWILCLVLFGFCLLVFTVILLGGLGVFPKYRGETIFSVRSNESVSDFMNGQKIATEIDGMSGLNQELHIFFKFWRSPDYPFGFQKNDLRFWVELYGYDTPTHLEEIYSTDTAIERDLYCLQGSRDCRPVHVEWLPFIAYKKFRFDIRLDNAEELSGRKLLSHEEFQVLFRYTNKYYTIVELAIRYILFISSGVNFLFFVIFTCFIQVFQPWLLEQRVVVFILFFLMLYNNPFFIFDIYVPGFVFPLANLVFVTTFICCLMLTILTLAHAAIKRPEQRTFFGFYFTKVLLLFAIWVISLALLVYVRFEDSLNPTIRFTDQSILFYGWAFLFFMLIVYLFNLGYYIFRAVGYWCKKKLPKSYSRRAQLMFFFSVIVVIGTIVNTILMTGYGFENSGQALAFFIGYNAYCTILCLFYLPAIKTRPKGEVRKEIDEYGMEDDLADVEYTSMDDEELEIREEEERLERLRRERMREARQGGLGRPAGDRSFDDSEDESVGEVEQVDGVDDFRGDIESEIRM